MRIIESLAEVSDQYDAVFCDLWGCLHNGVTAFPEAVAALPDLARIAWTELAGPGGLGNRLLMA